MDISCKNLFRSPQQTLPKKPSPTTKRQHIFHPNNKPPKHPQTTPYPNTTNPLNLPKHPSPQILPFPQTSTISLAYIQTATKITPINIYQIDYTFVIKVSCTILCYVFEQDAKIDDGVLLGRELLFFCGEMFDG